MLGRERMPRVSTAPARAPQPRPRTMSAAPHRCFCTQRCGFIVATCAWARACALWTERAVCASLATRSRSVVEGHRASLQSCFPNDRADFVAATVGELIPKRFVSNATYACRSHFSTFRRQSLSASVVLSNGDPLPGPATVGVPGRSESRCSSQAQLAAGEPAQAGSQHPRVGFALDLAHESGSRAQTSGHGCSRTGCSADDSMPMPGRSRSMSSADAQGAPSLRSWMLANSNLVYAGGAMEHRDPLVPLLRRYFDAHDQQRSGVISWAAARTAIASLGLADAQPHPASLVKHAERHTAVQGTAPSTDHSEGSSLSVPRGAAERLSGARLRFSKEATGTGQPATCASAAPLQMEADGSSAATQLPPLLLQASVADDDGGESAPPTPLSPANVSLLSSSAPAASCQSSMPPSVRSADSIPAVETPPAITQIEFAGAASGHSVPSVVASMPSHLPTKAMSRDARPRAAIAVPAAPSGVTFAHLLVLVQRKFEALGQPLALFSVGNESAHAEFQPISLPNPQLDHHHPQRAATAQDVAMRAALAHERCRGGTLHRGETHSPIPSSGRFAAAAAAAAAAVAAAAASTPDHTPSPPLSRVTPPTNQGKNSVLAPSPRRVHCGSLSSSKAAPSARRRRESKADDSLLRDAADVSRSMLLFDHDPIPIGDWDEPSEGRSSLRGSMRRNTLSMPNLAAAAGRSSDPLPTVESLREATNEGSKEW